jgi:hypothetical protein
MPQQRLLPNFSHCPDTSQRHREHLELQSVYNDVHSHKEEQKTKVLKKEEKKLAHQEFQERARQQKDATKEAAEKKKAAKTAKAVAAKLAEDTDWEKQREAEVMKMQSRVEAMNQKRRGSMFDPISIMKAKMAEAELRKAINKKSTEAAKVAARAKLEDDALKKRLKQEHWDKMRESMTEDELEVEREINETQEAILKDEEEQREVRIKRANAKKDMQLRKKENHERRLDGKRISMISRHL